MHTVFTASTAELRKTCTPQSQLCNVWRESHGYDATDIASVGMSRNWYPPAKDIILKNSM